ncbi:MAG: hypothetical protein BWZ07_01156 [Alphaproteobacteria bacterium ADurb.BinA280]|nr:MAG: hypothetical protein BWZ07_01156 [Alphaproteobacteria bacterium ADurb.BinA280]
MLGDIQQRLRPRFATEAQKIVEHSGLCITHPACQRNERLHIGQGVMRSSVGDTVGSGQVFQLETRQSIVASRPRQTLRAQCVEQSR